MINEAKKSIERSIAEGIKGLGFKKKKHFYYKLIKPNIYATIGVSSFSALHVKCRAYSIQIGILYEDVEKIAYELTGINELALMRPTMGIDIGYLMPENRFKNWEFSYEFSNEKEFSEMFKAIETYGNAYWEKYSDFDNFFHAFYIREGGILNDTRERYLPILYYMRGEKDKGVEFINETIRRRSIRPTDEELLAGRDPQSTIILRAGEGSKLTGDEMEKMLKSLPSGGSLQIVGAGCNGEVDPEYLKFAERYKAL